MMLYSYYKLDGMPCRIIERIAQLDVAQIYYPGTGFVAGPRMEIEGEGVPISKLEFDAMVLASRDR